MKKNIVRILSVIMAVILLATVPALLGCSSASNESMDMAVDMPVVEEGYDYGYDYDGDYSTSTGGTDEEPKTESTNAQSGEVERKIIRNAKVEIEAEDAKACYVSILDFVKSLGGYESNYNERSNEYSSGKYVNIDVEFRLPPEKLDEFVSRTGEFGEVTYCAVTSDEVTEEYYDLATRLESKERALDSYYALLEKAENIDDILTIQSRIDNLTEEIESIKGRLRLYDSLVDESTIYLYISQYTEAPVAEKEFEWNSLTGSDFLKLIKNGFLGVCNFVWSALQWIVIIVISLLPLLVVAGAVVFVILTIKKKSKKNEKKPEAKKNDGGDNVAPPSYM